ncbi:MAG: polysaccharide deacetylase family protein [Alphaproteobacteria bacterium]|nr:polysaccharide deacetylase family protein [Alphaproteobacteria bacterium]MBL6936478.1 polysaccharide deacetylase family protein [Alphaproteobacteria bacterium]MBL7098471.1 polysaccharide deacetylase family protein [Alphaproteobacteria bacterium]
MRFSRLVAAAAFSAAAMFASAAHAGDDGRIALFQPRTIFHSGLRDAHVVALTFDDGPNANTPAVLDALKALNIRATFFIVGNEAKRYPDILARIAAEGHLLANHSATHPLLGRRYDNNPELLLNQLRVVNDQIAPLMRPGERLYFRAPYGSWRADHAAILNADPVLRNYVGPIYWDEGGEISMTRDGYVMSAADWSCWKHGWAAATCAKGYLREIRRHDGGVVLMHCVHRHSGDLVEAVVPALVEEGYRFVRLDQVPEYRRYDTPTGTGAAVASNIAPKPGAAIRYAEFVPPAKVK